MQLTLRTLLAYLDDTLDPARAREIGQKVAENPPAQDLIDKIKRVTRRRGLATPPTGAGGSPSNPNTVAEYLSDTLPADQVKRFEEACLESDVHLAEVAACHQILTLVLTEQMRVPPTARKRMYQLVKGRESIPDRRPGTAIPVGGVREEAADDDHDDDAPFLLGLPAYSRGESAGRRVARVGALVALLTVLAVAVWLALPPADRSAPDDTGGVAWVPPTSQPKPPPTPGKHDDKWAVAMPKPDDADDKKKPDAMPGPPDEPKRDLVPAAPAARTDRVPVGKIDKVRGVVLRKPAGADAWERVLPDTPAVLGSDRLMALPGTNAPVRLDLDVTAELWGSLPELFPAPLYESTVTPALPADGFDADLTVHVGRVYLTTRRPGGAKVRLRFASEVWDVTLADAKTEVVFELTHAPSPGVMPEPPRTSAGLAVREGEATLQYRQQPAAKLAKGAEAYWDNKGGKAEVRPTTDKPGYWARLQVAPDAASAEAALTAVDAMTRSLTDPRRVRAAFEEAVQMREDRPPTRAEVAAARLAVLSFAAVQDLPGLVNALVDPVRGLLRMTAVEGLRGAVALDPPLADRFRQVLADRLKLNEDESAFALHLLRGFTPAEQVDPATYDRVVVTLTHPAVGMRELAINALAGLVDPQAPGNEALFRYDAGAPPEGRDPVYRLWLRRVEEMKQEAKKPPPGGIEVAPPPRKR
jgi:hypothetical protein